MTKRLAKPTGSHGTLFLHTPLSQHPTRLVCRSFNPIGGGADVIDMLHTTEHAGDLHSIACQITRDGKFGYPPHLILVFDEVLIVMQSTW